MQLVDFHYPLVLLQQMYGIELTEEDYEELALVCFETIGNKRTRVYKYIGNIDCNNTLPLPCNCYEDDIEAVLFPGEDWNRTTNKDSFGDLNSHWTEEYIEAFKHNTNILYGHGHFAKFQYWDHALHFEDSAGMPVLVIYHGEILDDNGLPELTNDEAIAIADYCAYWTLFKRSISTNNPNIMKMAQEIEDKLNKHLDAARVPSHINQNEMNEILDAKVSWHRHSYNKSTKRQ